MERSFLDQLVRALASGLLLVPACVLLLLMWIFAFLRIRFLERFFANAVFMVSSIGYNLTKEDK